MLMLFYAYGQIFSWFVFLLAVVEFGSACHLGVSTDTACIGVAKKLFQVDGLEKDENHLHKVN